MQCERPHSAHAFAIIAPIAYTAPNITIIKSIETHKHDSDGFCRSPQLLLQQQKKNRTVH